MKTSRIASVFLFLLVSFGLVVSSQAAKTRTHKASTTRKAVVKKKSADTEDEKPAARGRKGRKKVKAGSGRSGRTSKSKARRKMSKAEAKRAARLTRAFVASSDLKPMARQLLRDRTSAAYAGVEAYARRHPSSDAGSLAWLADGYARILDKDQARAIDSLKRAQAHAGDLGDYVAYYLAASYAAVGRSSDATSELRDFEKKYPDSVLLRDAMRIYGSGLLASGQTAEALHILERYRHPARSDFELMLGRAYARGGDYSKAAESLKRVYYGDPLSADADDAKAELDRLTGQGLVPPATFFEQKSRADLLAAARRNGDAAREYRALLAVAPPSDQYAVSVGLGVALHRSGNDSEARAMLQNLADSSDPSNAQRLYALAEMARAADDEALLMGHIEHMRQTAATSEYFEQALLLAGNMYLLRKDYDKAIDCYREMQQRFPNGKRASYVHWKAAWLSFRQGRTDEAKREFEEQVASYPNSAEASAALYWRARVAEEDHDTAKARAWYETLIERFPNYYYAERARARVKDLPREAVLRDAMLEKLPPSAPDFSAGSLEAPADSLHAQKALLLANGGLTDFAAKELRAVAGEGSSGWAALQMARIYKEVGSDNRALGTLKRAVPSYYALETGALPRPYWEILFPRPYWSDLSRYAVQNELDPYLVASLIRQESEFNPGAVSHANALGLMQLLPGTGAKVARELGIRRFSNQQLLSSTTNLQLGTRYFRAMVDQFGGRVEYALAAYNAGDHRVRAWLADGTYRDVDEFVESIPFTETREYVQAIVRNAAMYKRLYGGEASVAQHTSAAAGVVEKNQ